MRAFYHEYCFCAPFGALRLSARLIGGGWSYSESVILSRIDVLSRITSVNYEEKEGRGGMREEEGGMEGRSAEGGRRRDEPGKENVELKNCIALVVI